jgi:nitroreductase
MNSKLFVVDNDEEYYMLYLILHWQRLALWGASYQLPGLVEAPKRIGIEAGITGYMMRAYPTDVFSPGGIYMQQPTFIPLDQYHEYAEAQMRQRAADFYADIRRRRTVREFSNRPVPRDVIENCLRAAGTAPSGANQQPWYFVAVSDPFIKRQIREAAEEEERAFYQERAPEAWLEALATLGTDEHKPFLETAPYLIVIFGQNYGLTPDGDRLKHYYVSESVGIATGMLITAIHNAGLVSLTHTPSPMGFLSQILKRPANERAFLILVVGYPAEDAKVPQISKKSLEEIASFV